MTDHDPMHMALPDLLAFVAELEAKYRAWPLAVRAAVEHDPRAQVQLADLMALRDSLRRCVAELDRLLTEWDRELE